MLLWIQLGVFGLIGEETPLKVKMKHKEGVVKKIVYLALMLLINAC